MASVFAGLSRQQCALRLLAATSSSSASLSKSTASTLAAVGRTPSSIRGQQQCASTIIHTNFDDHLRTIMSAPPSSSVRNFSSTSVITSGGSNETTGGRVKLHVANLPPNATYASIRQTFEKHLPTGTPIIDCFLSGGGYAFVTVPMSAAGVNEGGSSIADTLLNNLGKGEGMELDGNLLRVSVAVQQAQQHKPTIKKLNDDGGPVGGGSIITTATTTSSLSTTTTKEDELKKMSLGQLADMSTIPGWTLVHNPPRHNTPRGSLVGTVVSTKMSKTVNVAIDRYRIVPKYRKRWKFTRKFMAHDEAQVCNEGDLVMIVPCQKISRHKHYMVREIVRRKGQL